MVLVEAKSFFFEVGTKDFPEDARARLFLFEKFSYKYMNYTRVLLIRSSLPFPNIYLTGKFKVQVKLKNVHRAIKYNKLLFILLLN